LFSRAFVEFRHDRYLAAARAAADHVWAFGLLRKGVGLCHGIAGNGYAFLALFRVTREAEYLQRAHDFAAFALSPQGRSVLARPDHPHALFEGSAGLCCFLADLLCQNPELASFPGFDL